jgi:hypothetical protein
MRRIDTSVFTDRYQSVDGTCSFQNYKSKTLISYMALRIAQLVKKFLALLN